MAAITIHLPQATLERAEALARSAGRPLVEVVQEITVEAIEERSRVVDGIKRGLADIAAGRVVDVAHVNARIDDVLRSLR